MCVVCRKKCWIIVASLSQWLRNGTRITSLYSCSQWKWFFYQQKSTNHQQHPELFFPIPITVPVPTCESRPLALQPLFDYSAAFHLQHRGLLSARVCWLMNVFAVPCQKTPLTQPPTPNPRQKKATLPACALQEHLAECQFQNSCLFQWMHKSVTRLPQIGSESVEVLFLLAVPGAQYFTAATVSHGEEKRWGGFVPAF